MVLETWKRLGRPGSRILTTALHKKGIGISERVVAAILAQQTSTQAFGPAWKSEGKIVAPEKNSLWQCDILDQTSRNAKVNGGNRFALIVVDVWSRRVGAWPLQTKTPDEVVEALKEAGKTLGGVPKTLETDNGGEFGGSFGALLSTLHILHVIKDPRHLNGLAIVDSAINIIRRIIGKELVDTKGESWVERLKGAVEALNARPLGHLYGASPDETDNQELTYLLDYNAGKDIAKQTELMTRLRAKLEVVGRFRDLLPRNQWQKQGQPRYSGEIFRVKAIRGGLVEDTHGHFHQLFLCRAVVGGESAVYPKSVRAGDAAKDEERRQAMQPFMEALKAHLGDEPSSIYDAGGFLATVPGYTQAVRGLKLEGLRQIALLFPEDFLLTGDQIRVKSD